MPVARQAVFRVRFALVLLALAGQECRGQIAVSSQHPSTVVSFRMPARYMLFADAAPASGQAGSTGQTPSSGRFDAATQRSREWEATDVPWQQQSEFDRAGSTNVPMDSWIYPALDRLAALGLIPTQSIAIRPWSRRECLRQLEEAEENVTREGGLNPGGEAEAEKLIDDLHRELITELSADHTATLESAYARGGTIAGPALADSYHFGQTWWNDFGRPLGRGTSSIEGFSARANYGRLFFYAREEAQHGPGNPAQSPEINQLINQLDTQQGANDPFIEPILAHAAYERYRPLELYAGVTFWGNALSFGKQELYWGPMVSGPLSFSSNAEPTWNVRFMATRPHPIPLLNWQGEYKSHLPSSAGHPSTYPLAEEGHIGRRW